MESFSKMLASDDGVDAVPEEKCFMNAHNCQLFVIKI
jgi:hypothetical protein